MENINTPLNEDEMELLEQFLLNRIDESIDTFGMDEGIFDISTLDGFFTAMVSGPEMIPPSTWLPLVWGDFEPEWESEQSFAEIFTLMLRHMNGIVETLMEFPNEFEPIFLVRHIDDKTYTIVDEWCEGYYLGFSLCHEQWITPDTKIPSLLSPIFAFTQVTDWVGHDLPMEEMQRAHQEIATNVREIHAYWLKQRGDSPSLEQSFKRSEPKVGRNDPCPCGSGKKFKKCCLH
jgi:uncharacterized protein